MEHPQVENGAFGPGIPIQWAIEQVHAGRGSATARGVTIVPESVDPIGVPCCEEDIHEDLDRGIGGVIACIMHAPLDEDRAFRSSKRIVGAEEQGV